MWLQKMKNRRCLYVIILAGVLLLCLWNANRRMSLQTRSLIQGLHTLSSNIVEVAVSPGEYEEKGAPHLLSRSEVEILIDAFLRADQHPVGGHNEPIYECLLHFKLRGGSRKVLIGSVHRNQEADFYVTDSLWQKNMDGTYHRGIVSRVRVPLLGQWIMTIDKRGLLSQSNSIDQEFP